MILEVFAVYDAVARCYATPFFLRSVAEAKRAFAGECRNPQSHLSVDATDYVLHHIGTFDSDSGAVVGFQPVLVAKATDFAPFRLEHADLEKKSAVSE